MTPQGPPEERRRGVLLQGPPFSGRDILAQELARLDERFVVSAHCPVFHFAKKPERPIHKPHELLEVGDGTWRAVMHESVDFFAGADDAVPVIPAGDMPSMAVVAQYSRFFWLRVAVWAPRDQVETAVRVEADKRGWEEAQIQRELGEWDSVVRSGRAVVGLSVNLKINSGLTPLDQAARRIQRICFPDSSG